MNNCPTCYQHTIASCTQTIQLNIKLAPNATYTITVTDKFGNVFVTSATTNSGGALTLDVSNFPPYLFSSYGGTLQLQFYASNNCNPAPFTICEVEYTCIIIKVVEVLGDDGSNHTALIPCCDDGSSGTTNPDADPNTPGEGSGSSGGNTGGGTTSGGSTGGNGEPKP